MEVMWIGEKKKKKRENSFFFLAMRNECGEEMLLVNQIKERQVVSFYDADGVTMSTHCGHLFLCDLILVPVNQPIGR